MGTKTLESIPVPLRMPRAITATMRTQITARVMAMGHTTVVELMDSLSAWRKAPTKKASGSSPHASLSENQV